MYLYKYRKIIIIKRLNDLKNFLKIQTNQQNDKA